MKKEGLTADRGTFVQHNKQKPHYFGGGPSADGKRPDGKKREDVGKRHAEKTHNYYGESSKGYDIGRNRVFDKPTSAGTFNSKHPGVTKLHDARVEREPFARKQSEWNGPEAQR